MIFEKHRAEEMLKVVVNSLGKKEGRNGQGRETPG